MNAFRKATEGKSWVLGPLLELPHVVHAAVLSGDGFIEGRSADLTQEEAEGAAAMMSALQGAARAATQAFSGNPKPRLRQTIIESDDGFVFVIPAGGNAYLAVFASPEVNLGVVAHQMQVQVKSLGEKVMTSPAREPAGDAQG
ncbi:roadblock/LC7 domain-containing protein [Streptantibioticus ferralitis]|uniref:Roadblock/LC7 domain-containing protein n=1 Tax=Streptantibioticus ferralitis TaxID=236510 RepID=A0ABT5YS39_9ACTN|nr:roadblock/LC7 domain-containing protein [Streptantibioticus ferralitis]MDF2254406.1 roadblock/LC7 domain-containing protein [Streptantibioticus ferralitis]